MNQNHLKCTVLNTENTPSIAKLYWDARRRMEFLQVPEHLLPPPPPPLLLLLLLFTCCMDMNLTE
jgi:hypothetical protein